MGGAERYIYISYFKQEATEDCLMEVSRLNLVGMKYDSDDMEVEYSVDNPNLIHWIVAHLPTKLVRQTGL